MNIKIYSRNEIIKLSKAQFDSNTALISIYDTDDVPPKITNKPQYTLFVAFDDVYADDMDEVNLDFFKPFDEKLAKRIAQFIMRHQDDVDTFICQCQFGQSRSAGVAAAIKEYFDGEGRGVFNDNRYSPNIKVYNLLVNQLRKEDIK